MVGRRAEPVAGDYTFPPTQGVISGYLGIAIAVLVVASIAAEGWSVVGLRWQLALVAFGVLSWALLLRPRVLVRAGHLVLVNPFSTISLPLHLVDDVQVRSTTKVRARSRTYVGIAVGRRTRAMVRAPAGTMASHLSAPIAGDWSGGTSRTQTADLVELWVGQAAADARRDRAYLPDPDDVVRNTPNVPLFIVLGVVALAIVVTLFL